MGELYRRLKDYSKTDYYPYHMPGHKRLLCGEFPREIMDIDITEIDGFDNLHHAEDILKRRRRELLPYQRKYLRGSGGNQCGGSEGRADPYDQRSP